MALNFEDSDLKLRHWKNKIIPSVDLYVIQYRLAVPFFSFECKPSHNSLFRGVNQLSGAMLMAHEILTSLNVDISTHTFGLIQYHNVAYTFI